jgi:hypothetical protein
VVSPVPSLGTGRRGRGWGEEDGGSLTGLALAVVVVGGLRRVLIWPYGGGSRPIREEKTARRRNRGPARSSAQAR